MTYKLENVVSILNDKIVTVLCSFENNLEKSYTFKCDRELAGTLQKDDVVIVNSRAIAASDNEFFDTMPNKKRAKNMRDVHGINTCIVVEVHDECEIDPDSTHDYKWVIQKLDLGRLRENVAQEQVLLDQLRKDRRKNLRDQVRQQYLGAPSGSAIADQTTLDDSAAGLTGDEMG